MASVFWEPRWPQANWCYLYMTKKWARWYNDIEVFFVFSIEKKNMQNGFQIKNWKKILKNYNYENFL